MPVENDLLHILLIGIDIGSLNDFIILLCTLWGPVLLVGSILEISDSISVLSVGVDMNEFTRGVLR